MIKETLCEFCVFKTFAADGHQSGCYLNRLEKLPHHKKDRFFIVDTYCAACRNIYWPSYSNSIKTMKEKVLEEIKISYDVFIFDADGDMNMNDVTSLDSVKKCINHISGLTYPCNKAFIFVKMTDQTVSMFNSMVQAAPKNMSIILTKDSVVDSIKTKLNASKSPYLLMGNLESNIDCKIIDSFNESVNIKLEPKLMFMSEEFCFVPRFLYNEFMNEKNPFESIAKYVESTISGN